MSLDFWERATRQPWGSVHPAAQDPELHDDLCPLYVHYDGIESHANQEAHMEHRQCICSWARARRQVRRLHPVAFQGPRKGASGWSLRHPARGVAPLVGVHPDRPPRRPFKKVPPTFPFANISPAAPWRAAIVSHQEYVASEGGSPWRLVP
eukprot:9755805-Alexandrium_andersonii.AAC.1